MLYSSLPHNYARKSWHHPELVVDSIEAKMVSLLRIILISAQEKVELESRFLVYIRKHLLVLKS